MDLQAQIDLLYKRMAAMEHEITSLKKGGSPSSPGGHRSLLDLKDILSAKKEISENLRLTHYSQEALGGHWDNEDYRREYLNLMKEIKSINARIAGMS